MEAAVRRSGWVTLVGVLFLIAGAFNLLWGVVALGVSLGGVDESAVAGELTRGDLEGLGIAGLIAGGLQLIAGGGILQRSSSARVLGIVLAAIVIVLNFGWYRVLDGWAFTGLVWNLGIIIILLLKSDEFA